jgi:hypothetical protein
MLNHDQTQEIVMFRTSGFLAIALNAATLVSVTAPAAALPQQVFGGNPHILAEMHPTTSMQPSQDASHALGPKNIPGLPPKILTGPSTTTVGKSEIPVPKMPASERTSVGNLREPIPQGPTPPIPQPPVGHGCEAGGTACRPDGGSSGGGKSGGGDTSKVFVVSTPTGMIPTPVVVQNRPILVAPRLAVPPRAAEPPQTSSEPPTPATDPSNTPAEPCKCLVKQYLDDGSVLFRDVCTHEAAVATKAELQAQAAATAQSQPQTAVR